MQVSVTGGLTVPVVEELMALENFLNFTLISSVVDPVCQSAGIAYFCTEAITVCNSNGTGTSSSSPFPSWAVGATGGACWSSISLCE